MKTSVITEIAAWLLGRKYWAVITERSQAGMYEINSYIFPTRRQAEEHRISLIGNRSLTYVETISFRSRREYPAPLPG